MHGLINKALQGFLRDTYGDPIWDAIVCRADLPFPEFEAMLIYDDALTEAVLAAAEVELAKPRADLLEDIGTYLVSNPKVEALRRLLRFGGVNFVEFLHSLDDLPDRARLAVADLDLPQLELREHRPDSYSLNCHSPVPGWGRVLAGVLRAMADDYGALVFLEHRGGGAGIEIVDVSLLETAFASGRSFELGARAG